METFRKISQIQRNLVLSFYIVFCLALIFPVWMIFSDLDLPSSVIILVVVLMVLGFVLIGSYFYLIVCLPDRLSRNFDGIRNDIADQSITTTEQFANRVNNFIIKQFDFVFLDVEYAAMGIKDNEEIFYNSDFPKDIFDNYKEVFEISEKSESVTYIGVTKYLDKKTYKYIIPIYFGDRNLGFMIVLTNKKLSNLFKGILSDFENLYVDDQLLHILNHEKSK